MRPPVVPVLGTPIPPVHPSLVVPVPSHHRPCGFLVAAVYVLFSLALAHVVQTAWWLGALGCPGPVHRSFDHVFMSFDPSTAVFDPRLPAPAAPFATQLDVFQACGKAVIEQALAGYNTSVFAYGQVRERLGGCFL